MIAEIRSLSRRRLKLKCDLGLCAIRISKLLAPMIRQFQTLLLWIPGLLNSI